MKSELGPVALIFFCLVISRELYPYADIHDPNILVKGYHVEEVVDGLGGPTCLHWANENWLLVCDRDSGSLKAVMRNSVDAFTTHTIITGLEHPHGALTWQDPGNGTWRLFVSDEGSLFAWNIPNPDVGMWNLDEPQTLVEGVPSDGNHDTNAVMDGRNGTLLWHVGSTCNICVEDDVRNAALLWVDPWTGEHGVAASGVRNSFDGTWVPEMGYAFSDNGRDWEGDHPPEEVNLFLAGADYGWPADDPEHPVPTGTLGPIAKWTPHTSLNGMDARPNSSSLPGDEHTVYATVYGSWNTALPKGHEIVRIDFYPDADAPQGWSGDVTRFAVDLGTPLPLRFSPDGNLYYATFGGGGTLYRIVAN